MHQIGLYKVLGRTTIMRRLVRFLRSRKVLVDDGGSVKNELLGCAKPKTADRLAPALPLIGVPAASLLQPTTSPLHNVAER